MWGNANPQKITAVVLYLLRGCGQARPALVALLKMIYRVDYEHYQKHLRSITDADYVTLPQGPVIDNYRDILADFVKRGLLQKHERDIGFANPKVEYVALQEPDETVLSESELDTLENVLSECRHWNSTQASRWSHGTAPWALGYVAGNKGRAVPYRLFRWFENLPDEDQLLRTRKWVESQPEVMATIENLNRSAA